MAVEPRKTFSGRRRKAKGLVPLVEGSGRLRRPPPSERPESVSEVVAIVLAQPHRRGFTHGRDSHLGTTVGRLIEANPGWWGKGCPPKASFLEAARRYQKDWTSYQAAVTGTRRPLAVTDGGTRIDDPDLELKKRRDAERAWADAGRALRDCGEAYERACHFTICDHQSETWTPPIWVVISMPIALRALIQHYGLEAS
jgi:hypothetical protein